MGITANFIANKQPATIHRTLLSRLELAFWNTTIYLLGKSRFLQTCVRIVYPFRRKQNPGVTKTRVIFWAFLGWIGAILAVSLAAGMVLYAPKKFNPELVESNLQAAAVPALNNGQHNILIINIDKFDRTPNLVSLWLVMYFPNTSSVTLLPLHPAPVELNPESWEYILQRFQLSASGKPADGFLNALAARQIWWDGYLVLDNVARQKLSRSLGGKAIELSPQERQNLFADFLGWQPKQITSIEEHVEFLRDFCSQLSLQGAQIDLTRTFGKLGDHYRTNLDLIRLQQDWGSIFNSPETFSCEFPFSNLINTEVSQ